MATPEDDSQPRYLHLQGKTQFEIGQSIDAAFAEVEQSIHQQSEQAVRQWWYQNLETQVQEVFNLPESALPKGDILSQASFFQACVALYHAVMVLPREAGSKPSDKVMARLLDGALSDTIDMMRARKIWRFDLQRSLQVQQGQLIHEFQHPTDTC